MIVAHLDVDTAKLKEEQDREMAKTDRKILAVKNRK
jgi:hypothetical protein